ncbi:hypothetical protein [Streptomyces sp. NBC_00696]|uniref:hypothetical protein n=1 Tax=Streptomyces sp. NBC_00696 TaxID=2903672 RepID=UPI002E31195E|nr:hypothetical protein [Streptomyces sp. NBC_00696]
MSKRRERPATKFDAPDAWQIWHHPDPESDGFESLLYSDSLIHGEPYWSSPASVGPITLVPTAAELGGGLHHSGQVVVRFRHGSPVLPPGERPYTSSPDHYVEMYAGEEIAALLSLILGVRLRDGGLIRRFEYGKDPAGNPELHDHRPPALIPVPDRRVQLPGLRGAEVNLGLGVRWLSLYPRLAPAEAIVLAKAARCYADALWIGDNDPQQAWLHLVTALETVAVLVQIDTLDPIDVLNDAHSELVDVITNRGASDILPKIADLLVETSKATRRFLDFTCRYAPQPPTERPGNHGMRVDWDTLRKSMSLIYGHRSNYLHAGRPMPPGMIGLNLEYDEDGRPPERIEQDSTISAGYATWKTNQVPMFLWVFAYITRGTLLNWWQERLELPDADSSALSI